MDEIIKRSRRKKLPPSLPLQKPSEMRVLFFDTETNGLPKGPRGSSNPSDWPAIVQLAWQVWEFPSASPDASTGGTSTKEPSPISAVSYIICPSPELVWDLGSQAFHTISKERATTEGVDAGEALTAFRAALAATPLVVAHNLAFDKPVLDAEIVRRGLPPLSWPSLRGGRECCTMLESKDFCRLPSMYSRTEYKYPKLSELHALLFGNQTSIVFHNAANDVEATVQCFRRLVTLGVIPLGLLLREA